MSWFSENYEKACLGASVVVAAGLGYTVMTSNDDSTDTGSAKISNDVSVSGLASMEKVKQSLAKVHVIHQADVDGRKVDLFTGVALFSRKNAPERPVDLLKSEPVHPGIPNTWWLKYGLDPGFENSPALDPDEDGFANREEHDAGTDPTDFSDHPNPIVKLQLVEQKTTQVHIKPLSGFGNNQFLFKLENRVNKALNTMNPQPIGFNTVIPFTKPLMQNRFKFLRVEKQQNPNTGAEEDIWVIEDQKPNKKGDLYRFDRRGNLAGLKKRSKGVMDTKFKFVLKALKQGGNTFELDEGSHFTLPYDAEAKEKSYYLRKVDLEKKQAEVEYTDADGNQQTHVMPFKQS